MSDEPAQPRTRQTVRRKVLNLVVGFAIVVGLYQWTFGSIGQWARHRSIRTESVEALRTATSAEQAAQLVGFLGVVLHTKDGGWVAIRYRDSHSILWCSSAVALTSDGQWFESQEHFCGMLANHRMQRKQQQEDLAVAKSDEEKRLTDEFYREVFDASSWMVQIEQLDSIRDVGEILRRNGFADLKP